MEPEEKSIGLKLRQWLATQDLNSLTPRKIKSFFLDALLDNQNLRAALNDIAEHRNFHAAIHEKGALRKIHLQTVRTYLAETYSEKIFTELSEILTEGVEKLPAEKEGQTGHDSAPETSDINTRFHQKQLQKNDEKLEASPTKDSTESPKPDNLLDDLAAKLLATEHDYDAEAMQKKLLDGSFDFDDFTTQIDFLNSVAGLGELMKAIPDTKIDDEALARGEEQLRKIRDMVDVMTFEERQTPELLLESAERRKRISKASKHTEADVSKVIEDFMTMRRFMQTMAREDQSSH